MENVSTSEFNKPITRAILIANPTDEQWDAIIKCMNNYPDGRSNLLMLANKPEEPFAFKAIYFPLEGGIKFEHNSSAQNEHPNTTIPQEYKGKIRGLLTRINPVITDEEIIQSCEHQLNHNALQLRLTRAISHDFLTKESLTSIRKMIDELEVLLPSLENMRKV